MGASEILTSAGEIIGVVVNTTQTLVTALPFMLLPMGFIFGRKIVGFVKNLTMQGRGKKRG